MITYGDHTRETAELRRKFNESSVYKINCIFFTSAAKRKYNFLKVTFIIEHFILNKIHRNNLTKDTYGEITKFY